jgi:hypothetical protein
MPSLYEMEKALARAQGGREMTLTKEQIDSALMIAGGEVPGDRLAYIASTDVLAAAYRAKCAEVEELRKALGEYANEHNWEDGEIYNSRRVWLEPDSVTPREYDGWEIDRKALEGKE